MENVKFENLQLYPEILKAVKYMGFEEASPIQAGHSYYYRRERYYRAGADRYRKDRCIRNSPSAENQSKRKETPEHCVVSNKRTGYSGCRGNPQSGEIYAWNQRCFRYMEGRRL